MKDIEIFTDNDINVILESISDISYVSRTYKSEILLKNNKQLLDELAEYLLTCKEEKSTVIYRKYFSLIKDILELTLATYKDDEIQTYTGQTKPYIQDLIRKMTFEPSVSE